MITREANSVLLFNPFLDIVNLKSVWENICSDVELL